MNSKVMIFYIKKSHVLGRLKQSLNCLSGPIHVQHAPYKLLAFAYIAPGFANAHKNLDR